MAIAGHGKRRALRCMAYGDSIVGFVLWLHVVTVPYVLVAGLFAHPMGVFP